MIKGTFRMDKADFQTYVTGLIAVIVVLGGGVTLVFVPTMSDKVIPIMMVVITYFFSSGSMRTGITLGQQSNKQNVPV